MGKGEIRPYMIICRKCERIDKNKNKNKPPTPGTDK